MTIGAAVAATVGLTALKNTTDLMRSARAGSLIEYTKPMRVEPIVLIDSDCMFHDGLPDLMQSLQSIFAGYYLQAVAVSATIGNISVMGQLGKLNPNRDPLDAALDGAAAGAGLMAGMSKLLATESYAHGLPSIKGGPVKYGLEALGLEATKAEAEAEAARLNASLKKSNDKEAGKSAAGMSVGKDAGRAVAEVANLSVGKILSVEITDGNAKATIPVTIRLLANSIPSAALVHILSESDKEVDNGSRWHQWKAGRLATIKDMIFCQDLIEAHRKKLMNDKTGMYASIIDRKRKNQLSTVLSGNPSVATASNMVVLSDTTLAELELETNYQFKNFAQREKIFAETSLMIVAVIDKRWDRVTFYHRSIPETTTVSFRDMKMAAKGNGPDVGEILKAYQLGNSPSL